MDMRESYLEIRQRLIGAKGALMDVFHLLSRFRQVIGHYCVFISTFIYFGFSFFNVFCIIKYWVPEASWGIDFGFVL